MNPTTTTGGHREAVPGSAVLGVRTAPAAVGLFEQSFSDDGRWRRVLAATTPLRPEDLADPGDLPEWVLLCDAPVIPEPHIVSSLLVGAGPDAGAVYSDFDVVDAVGRPNRTVRPGGWSVERARWSDYTGPLLLVRSKHIDPATLGCGVRRSALLQASRNSRIRHVPASLYSVPSWAAASIPRDERNRMLAEAGAPYRRASGGRTAMDSQPSISVVIPTRCTVGTIWNRSRTFIDHALNSIVATHPGSDLEFVVVVDSVATREVLLPWRERLGDRLVLLETTGPFNFARKVNTGVAAAGGDVVAIVNDDIEVITPGALTELAAVASESDVGAVGALLRYADRTIQHAGLVFADGGVHHFGVGQGRAWESANGELMVNRDVSGVTAACLVQRRSEWNAVGGLDPLLPVSFNDVDYCWRLRQQGKRIVQCNSVELFHFESQTRAPGAEDWEVIRLRSRLGDEMVLDVFTPRDAVELPSPLRQRMTHRWYRLRRRFTH